MQKKKTKKMIPAKYFMSYKPENNKRHFKDMANERIFTNSHLREVYILERLSSDYSISRRVHTHSMYMICTRYVRNCRKRKT